MNPARRMSTTAPNCLRENFIGAALPNGSAYCVHYAWPVPCITVPSMAKTKKTTPGQRLGIYLPATDYEAGAKLAEAQGIPLTTWLRNTALAAIRERRQPPKIGDLRSA